MIQNKHINFSETYDLITWHTWFKSAIVKQM